MDEAGVQAVVNLPIDWGPDYPAAAPIGDIVSHSLECARRHPGRIIPFAGIDPRRDGAPDRVEEWIARDGARGLKLYPNCGWWPADDRAMEVYAVCARLDVPVLFHTGDPLPLLDPKFALPSNLLPVVEAFPDLRVWLGHAGWPRYWDETLEVVQSSNAAKAELSLWLWNDFTHEDELALARKVCAAITDVGVDRLLFGTDNVSGSKERPAGFLKQIVDAFLRLPSRAEEAGLALSDADLAQIMGANAAQDLKFALSESKPRPLPSPL
jgi:predicted TIM-barrel fold metal-dependent hydrolase